MEGNFLLTEVTNSFSIRSPHFCAPYCGGV